MRVTVVGAGPAGASLAITLAGLGLDVLLADPAVSAVSADPAVSAPAARAGGGSWRVGEGWKVGEGLPGAAGPLLRELGVWEAFQAAGHLPCAGFLSRWGGPEPRFRSTLYDPHGPSWQLERARFDRTLREAATGAGVRGPVPWRLVSASRGRSGWSLGLADGPEIRPVATDFVVDATGRRAGFTRLLGVRRRAGRSLLALAVPLRDPDPENATTIVETAACGWWYASRVPGGGLVVSLFTDAPTCAEEGLAEPDGWRRALGRTDLVRARVGWPAVSPVAPPRVTAAGSSWLPRPGDRDWIAVGDAACAHDPLSSRGLYHALETGVAGARAVAGAAGGDGAAVPAYTAEVTGEYRRYLDQLDWFYAQEDRFADAGFWRRRRAAVASPAG